MMDGICFPATKNRTFALRGTLHAGDPPPNTPLLENQAWRINTGAPLPSGCNTVVPIEELQLSETHAKLREGYSPTPDAFIHPRGSDMEAGKTILKAGTHLNSAALSIAASIGVTELLVSPPLSVFLLTTGKEAIPPSETPSPYQIRRSHPSALKASLNTLGIQEITHLHLEDDRAQMEEALTTAISNADLILTCGAISKGSTDHLRSLFDSLVGPPTFHGISQRPGKPMAYWAPTAQTPAVFALPGNALSTLVTFHRYVAPFIRKESGLPPQRLPLIHISHQLPEFPLTRFLPITLDSADSGTLCHPNNSGDFSQLAHSHGFIEIPPFPLSQNTFPFTPWL